jgi:NAD-dependent dihydropyrimidine dehydrogenase PreA subunit
MYTAQASMDAVDSGTQTYTKVPCAIDVVADSTVVSPFDDWKAIINRQQVFVIDPCSCKTMHAAALGDFRYETDNDYRLTDGKNDRTNICLAMGELAEYYIWKGVGRQVTREEAMASVQQSVEDGLVIQHFCTNDTEVICQCRCDYCAILTPQKALAGVGDATYAMSNYTLALDKDSCIQCGACIDRCPMEAITFGDDGYPQMGPECVCCGQCAYICPGKARVLEPKPLEEQVLQTANVGEDWIEKAIYRRMKGTIEDFLPGMSE